MKLPEGPKASPRWLSRQFKTNPLGLMDAMGDRYGDIFTVMAGSTPIVYVSNPQGIKQIFTSAKEITASGKLNQGGALLVGNNGLLMLDGLRHKHRRQLLMPPLHGTRVKAYGQRICQVTDKVMNDLAIGKALFAYPTVQKITLEVILQALFGLDEGERYEQFRQLLSNLLSFARSRWLKLALRIYPTQVVTFPRLVESPIQVMDYELSPGTVVIGCIYLTHQREDLYPQPKQFQPERFLERQYSQYEFLPFGGGARRCPGEVLALFEMKLVLATILSHYQLALAHPEKVEKPQARGVNYPPASGLKMLMLSRRASQERSPQLVNNFT